MLDEAYACSVFLTFPHFHISTYLKNKCMFLISRKFVLQAYGTEPVPCKK